MNILVIVCDTLRADHLSCYGYFRETSPNIDRIAGEGVLFEDFYNAGCPTGPGFTCIYTGLHTIHHKYYRFLVPNIRQVDDTIFTMPEILRLMGYRTVAFDNLIEFFCKAKHWVRGYEFYINCGRAFPVSVHDLRSEEVNRRLIPWIKNISEENFFIFVHYWDPHLSYVQPEPYRSLFQHKKGDLSDLEVKEAPAGYKYVPGWGKVGEFADGEVKAPYGPTVGPYGPTASIDLYDGEIAYVDHAIGEVVETLKEKGLLDETLVVVTSDHGEQLGQHYSYGWEHGGLHDAVTHIPLVMRCPKKLPKGVKVRGFCQQIDILPTILDLLNVRIDILKIDGKSIVPLLKGEQVRDKIFMESSSGQRAIRTEEWELLADEWVTKRPQRELELYNIKDDPMEVINLAKIEKGKSQELRDALHGWVKSSLKEGESDPAVYADEEEYNPRRLEYREKLNGLMKSLRMRRGYEESNY